jgi:NADH pyrophosphatase NudC (nudix superfamily)
VEERRRYCPQCNRPLVRAECGGRPRLACADVRCGFVFWDNPAPVVAAIVEYGDQVVLVRNHGWPGHWYGLVTGFLEPNETPEEAALREVREEVGLDARLGGLIGVYPFYRMNQVIIAYHVRAELAQIRIDPAEIADYKLVPIATVQPWDAGTGVALRDWLRTRGIERELVALRR